MHIRPLLSPCSHTAPSDQLPLVVDRVIVFSSYFGGAKDDRARMVDVDSDGYIYVTGWTNSISFPVPLGSDRTANGEHNKHEYE